MSCLRARHGSLTMIIRWRGVRDVQYDGVQYGQREKEFPKFLELPRATGGRFQVALIGEGRELLEKHGWKVLDGGQATRDLDAYRKIIAESRGEFGVAKNCYVDTRGGWFSDRSASFLAAGRPVVIQDTGIGGWLPVGRGVLTFQSHNEAVTVIAELDGNYEEHALHARHIAEIYFDASKVLEKLLNDTALSEVKASRRSMRYNHAIYCPQTNRVSALHSRQDRRLGPDGASFGGMVWQVLHYLVPLRRLGFDVWYVEDSDELVYDALSFEPSAECETNIEASIK